MRGKLLLFQITISAFFLFILYSQVNIQTLASTILSVPIMIFLSAFIINLFGVVFFNVLQVYYHWCGKLSIKGNIKEYFFFLRTDFIYRFYSLFIPTAGTAGLKVYRYKRYGINTKKSFDLVVLNKLLQFVLIFGVVSVVWSYDYFIDDIRFSEVFLSIVVALFLLFTLVIAVFLYSSVQILSVIVDFFKNHVRNKILSRKLSSLSERVKNIDSDEYSNKLFFVVNVILQLLSILVVSYSQYMLVNELGYQFDYQSALVLRCLVLGAMLIPISFAGMGFRELGTVGVLSVYGISYEIAMAVASILLVYQLLISLCGFLIMLFESLQVKNNEY